MCQCFEKTKFKISESSVRKGLLMEKASTKKMGGLMAPQIHLAVWTLLRVFSGLGGLVCKMLVVQVLIGGP